MRSKFKNFFSILKETFKGWNADDPFRQSATIAYYAIFSLPGLLVLIINVAGFFWGTDAVSGEIAQQTKSALGSETAKQINDMIAKAGASKAGILSSIIAIVTLISGATGVFIELQKTLNQIWDVKQKPVKGLRRFKNQLFSFGLIVSIGFLLLVSLVVSTALAAFSRWLEGSFPDAVAYLFYILDFVVSLSVITILFALMFKVLPNVKTAWKDVIIGSILTAVLFILGKYALSFYFGKANPGSAYGVAGSVVLILLWISYSSMIVFFGAEFTKQYATHHGHEIVPTKDAEIISGDSLEQEHKIAEEEEKRKDN